MTGAMTNCPPTIPELRRSMCCEDDPRVVEIDNAASDLWQLEGNPCAAQPADSMVHSTRLDPDSSRSISGISYSNVSGPSIHPCARIVGQLSRLPTYLGLRRPLVCCSPSSGWHSGQPHFSGTFTIDRHQFPAPSRKCGRAAKCPNTSMSGDLTVGAGTDTVGDSPSICAGKGGSADPGFARFDVPGRPPGRRFGFARNAYD